MPRWARAPRVPGRVLVTVLGCTVATLTGCGDDQALTATAASPSSWLLGPPAGSVPAEQRVEAVLSAGLSAGVMVAALAAWTTWCGSLLRALALAAPAPRRTAPPLRVARAGQPGRWVCAAALALGTGALGLAGAAPVAADTGSGPPCPPAGDWQLDGLVLPVLPAARPMAPGRAVPGDPHRTERRGSDVGDAVVVVAPGDSLWSLAASRLGPGAPPAAVDRRWPRWYAANRAAIGPDPDLLLPGVRLRVPPTEPTTRRPHP